MADRAADYPDIITSNDEQEARELAGELYASLKTKDPATELTYSRLETYCWVLWNLPRTENDKTTSKALISQMLQRSDIPQWELAWYKEKYGLD